MKLTVRDVYERIKLRRRRGVSTVRYMFPLMFTTLGIWGATYLAGGSGSYVILTPIPAYVEAGQEVSVLVEAVAASPVNTVDIEVAFPTEALTPLSVSKGGSVITLWTEDPKISNGKVTLRGGVFRKGFIGRHTIATIKAKATQNGDADVLVRNSVFLAGDGKGTELTVDKESNQKAVISIGAKSTTLKGSVSVQVYTDIDGDKDVDIRDIEAFMIAWKNGNKTYDFSGDGKMTFRDFAIILSDSFFK
jgi:hypothetical protein